jgi:hypothetical protein
VKKFILPLVGLLSVAFLCRAQEEAPLPLTYQSLSLGMGGASVYDTYLSPAKYSGWNISLMGEQIKNSRLWDGRLIRQQQFNLEFADTDNPASTIKSYWGYLQYDYGLFYRFDPVQKLQLFAGVQGDLMAGAIHNLRNTNNPVNAKADLNLNLSAIAVYPLQIKRQPIRLRYQISTTFVGAMFSPEFGQSYYEIGMGHSGPLFHFAAWHNHLSLRNTLSIELPMKTCTLRLTASNWFYQTRVNHLQTQIVSNSVYFGVSKYFHVVSAKNPNKTKYRYVFE